MTDVLIIGAGPAGSTAAAFLMQKGYKVLVLEKQKFPRFVVGESMLPASMQFIEKAGMMEAVMSASFQYKDGAAFFYKGQYHEFNFSQKTSPGYGFTFEVPRDTFDHVLIKEAQRQGADVRFEVEVTGVDFGSKRPKVTTKTREGEVVVHEPKFVLDASGFGRTLPRLLDLETPSNFPLRGAVLTQFYDRIPAGEFDRQKILVTIHPQNLDVWYWCIPFSNSRTSVGCVAAQSWLDQFTGTPEERIWKLIREDEHLANLLRRAEHANPITVLKGYAANVKTMTGKNWALLGNAAEFLDPVFSSGVAIAMRSASMASDCVDKELRGESVDWDKEFSEPLRFGVDTFRAYVESWYDGSLAEIFFAPNKDPKILRMICSVLAGYGWDHSNPYCGPRARRRLLALAQACRTGKSPAQAALA
jgi:flavin-dependent dehydrogenase